MPSFLANLLRRMRLKSHPRASMSSVAEKLGVEDFYLSKLESGAIKKPTVEVLKKMAALYVCGLGDAETKLLDVLRGMTEGKLPFDDVASLQNPMFLESFAIINRTSTLSIKRVFGEVIPEGALREDSTAINVICPAAVLATRMAPESWIQQSFTLERFKKMLHEKPCRMFMTPSVTDKTGVCATGLTENRGDLFILASSSQGGLATADDERIEDFNRLFSEYIENAYYPDEAAEVVDLLLKLPIVHEHYKGQVPVVKAPEPKKKKK